MAEMPRFRSSARGPLRRTSAAPVGAAAPAVSAAAFDALEGVAAMGGIPSGVVDPGEARSGGTFTTRDVTMGMVPPVDAARVAPQKLHAGGVVVPPVAVSARGASKATMENPSDAVRRGTDSRMLPLGQPVAVVDAWLSAKVIPEVRTEEEPRLPDSMLVHIFGETRRAVHGLVDAFAKEGAAVRVDAADPALVLRASVPLRGDAACVAMRFRRVGKEAMQQHCVAAEPTARLSTIGSRLELRHMLRRVVASLAASEGLSVVAEASSPKPYSTAPDGLSVPPMPNVWGGKDVLFDPVAAPGTGSPGSGRAPAPAESALVEDASDEELAAFARYGPGPSRQSTGAAVLDALADGSAPAGEIPALARRTVDAAWPSPAELGPSSSPGQTDTAPTEEEIRGAKPMPGPLSAVAVAEPSPSPEPEAPASASASAAAAPGALPFAAASSHIRSCLAAPAERSAPPSVADDELRDALLPLAAAVGSDHAPTRRSAITSTARLVTAQRGLDAAARLSAAMRRHGVTGAIGTLLLRVAEAHAREEAKNGGGAATRDAAVAEAVVARAAEAAGLDVLGLTAALRTVLALGAAPADLCPADEDEKSLTDAVRRWSSLPDGDSAGLVQLQRTAVEAQDLGADDE